MKSFLVALLLISCESAISQEPDFISMVFKDTANFTITRSYGAQPPKEYALIEQSDKWDTKRFKLTENTESDSVRKVLMQDPNHPFNNAFLFKDAVLNKQFDPTQKEYLYSQATALQPHVLTVSAPGVNLIKSFIPIRQGFFFSVTDPIITADKQYAFVDLTIYYKEQPRARLNETYFAKSCIIFQHVQNQGWTCVARKYYLLSNM